MNMKKKVFAIVVVLALVILLFPIRMNLRDGGSVQYKSLTYSITKVHSLISDEETIKEGKVKPYDDGFVVMILGLKVFDNVE